MVQRASVARLSVVGLVLFGSTCTSPQLPHSGEAPAYPLRGLHAAVPCAGCHGVGTPQALPVLCLSCHDDDRPTPDHFVGQGCIGCHVEDGWAIVETTVPTPPTPPTDTGFDHSTLPEDQLCWECHEEDRSAPDHYADPTVEVAPDDLRSDDCSGCHTVTGWADNAFVHPARIPHGVGTGAQIGEDCDVIRPPEVWVSGCVGCHPAGTDTYSCFSCHNEDEVPGELAHDGGFEERQCLGCHIDAESTDCP